MPLCPIHHRSLHDAGREDEWWQAKGIDAKAEAEKLWRATHPAVAVVAATLMASEVRPAASNGTGAGIIVPCRPATRRDPRHHPSIINAGIFLSVCRSARLTGHD